MFKCDVLCQCFIRIPAALFDLPLIDTQMLSYNVADGSGKAFS